MTDKQLNYKIQIKMLELSGLVTSKLMRTRQDVIDAGKEAQLEYTKQVTGTVIEMIENFIFPKLNTFYGPQDEEKND